MIIKENIIPLGYPRKNKTKQNTKIDVRHSGIISLLYIVSVFVFCFCHILYTYKYLFSQN